MLTAFAVYAVILIHLARASCVGLFALCSAGVLLVPDFGWMLNSVIGISSLLLFIGGLFLLKVVGRTEVEELMKIVGNKIPFLK